MAPNAGLLKVTSIFYIDLQNSDGDFPLKSDSKVQLSRKFVLTGCLYAFLLAFSPYGHLQAHKCWSFSSFNTVG